MIFACFFEPICLPLGVCTSRLGLIPAGVTTHRRTGSCKHRLLFFAFICETVNKDFQARPWLSKHIFGRCLSLNCEDSKHIVFIIFTRRTMLLLLANKACGDGSQAVTLVCLCLSLTHTVRDSPQH